MRTRYTLKGFRRQLVRKLENALNSVKAMDVREATNAENQDRGPNLFSSGSDSTVGRAITSLLNRINVMKQERA